MATPYPLYPPHPHAGFTAGFAVGCRACPSAAHPPVRSPAIDINGGVRR